MAQKLSIVLILLQESRLLIEHLQMLVLAHLAIGLIFILFRGRFLIEVNCLSWVLSVYALHLVEYWKLIELTALILLLIIGFLGRLLVLLNVHVVLIVGLLLFVLVFLTCRRELAIAYASIISSVLFYDVLSVSVLLVNVFLHA